jgi:AP endonuclease-1
MPSSPGKRAARGDISPPVLKRQKRQSTAKEVKYQESPDEEVEVATPKKQPNSAKKKTPVKVTRVLQETIQKNGVKVETEIKEESKVVNGTTVEKITVKRKRKTPNKKEAETMTLASRTIGSKILVGAHVSAAGGMVFLVLLDRIAATNKIRGTQLHCQQCTNWRQRFLSLPQVSTQMGICTSFRRAPDSILIPLQRS